MSNINRLHHPKGAPDYRMNAKGAKGEIYLYGVIGLSSDNFFGLDGITAKQFADDLKNLGKVSQIDLRVNSDGGVVDDARAIYNLLVQHPAQVNTFIDGLAASAASFISLAGKTIDIAEGGYVMIHNARGGARGESKDLRAAADLMDSYTQSIRNTYAARTRQPDDKLKQWMDAETWFTAEEAKQYGFVDTITQNMRAIAAVANPQAFHNLPAALKPNNRRAAAAFSRIAALNFQN